MTLGFEKKHGSAFVSNKTVLLFSLPLCIKPVFLAVICRCTIALNSVSFAGFYVCHALYISHKFYGDHIFANQKFSTWSLHFFTPSIIVPFKSCPFRFIARYASFSHLYLGTWMKCSRDILSLTMLNCFIGWLTWYGASFLDQFYDGAPFARHMKI